MILENAKFLIEFIDDSYPLIIKIYLYVCYNLNRLDFEIYDNINMHELVLFLVI